MKQLLGGGNLEGAVLGRGGRVRGARCSAAVRGKAKERVRLRVVTECIVLFRVEVRHGSSWEKGVSSGVFAAGQCYVSGGLALVEADPPESWQVGEERVGL